MTKEMFRKIVGENIRKERLNRGMSIDELAELLELTTGFVGLIERGRRGATAYNLFKLSEIFNSPIDYLVMEHDSSSSVLKERDKTDHLQKKKSKITSYIYDLGEAELDFVISVIKGMKRMNKELYIQIGELDEEDGTEEA